MSITLMFPTNYQLDTVVQEYTVQTENFIGAEILPETEAYTQKVRWDEKDSDRGMTAPHAMGTDPKIDKRPGSKTREYEPIPFKESDVLKENEILRSRELGTINNTIDLSRAVGEMVKNRMDKTKIRMESLRWQTLRGSISINENGVKVSETFGIQTHNVSVDFDSLSTAKPLAEFNAVKLKFRGTGASAAGSKAYLNQTTTNWLLENQNDADLKGFQNSNFANLPYSLEEMNKIMTARGLPQLVTTDEGYIDEDGNYQLFVPDGEIIVVGKRPAGQKVGDFCSTPSLHRVKAGKNLPGFFSILEVNGVPSVGSMNVSLEQLGAGSNPQLKTTGGIYGGTRLFYPRSVIKMVVAT
jgi:hypothetical protein